MSESGATPSLDIQRLRTDPAYWSEQQDAGNIPIDLIKSGVVPIGYSREGGRTPTYMANGPNPIPVTGVNRPGTSTIDPSLNRFPIMNSDGTVRGPGQRPRPRPSIDSEEIDINNIVVDIDSILYDVDYVADTTSTISENFEAPDTPRTEPSASDSDPAWQRLYDEVDGRHNLLHDYNSYNYIITLVAISDDQVKDASSYKGRIVSGGNIESNDFYVIAKSGGFRRDKSSVWMSRITTDANGNPETQSVSPGNYKDLGYEDIGVSAMGEGDRDKDLFIDDLIFDTRPGINDMGHSNLTTGRFNVTEPHGVGGFYKELWAGARHAGHLDYLGAPFLLVISFVGRKVGEDGAEVPDRTTRYIPILLKGSQMSVDASGAKYSVEFMGYNSGGASASAASTWDVIEPRINTIETVESIACSVFHANTLAHQKIMDEMQASSDDETKTEIARRMQDQDAIQASMSQSGLGANTPVVKYQGHKYYCWFPEDFSGAFASQPGNFQSSLWETQVEAMLAQGESFRGEVVNINGNPNQISKAGLNDEISPVSGIAIADHERKVQANQDEKNRLNTELAGAQSNFNTQVEIFNQKREQLANVIKNSQGVREDDLEASLRSDLLIRPNTAEAEVKSTVDEAQDQAINFAVQFAGVPDGPPSGRTPPQQPGLTEAEITQVITLRNEINTAAQQINSLRGTIARAEKKIEDLEAEASTYPNLTYNIQRGGSAWSFKKGVNLKTVLDILVTNSQYMQIFQQDAILNQIEQSEYIPWYNITIHTVPIAFDVSTMRPVYEIHYVLSPYSIHYSKMPGVNIIFSTKKLRKRAVREYNYIFTGKNIDVLNFDIKYNNLFTMPLLLRPPNPEALGATTRREEIVNTYLSAQDQAIERISTRISSKLGETGFTPAQAAREKVNYRDIEITNRNNIGVALKEFLYNPPFEQALIRAQIEIVGDPVYVIGSGITERPIVAIDDIITRDGEMNTFTREADIIFKFRNGADTPTASELKNGQYLQQLQPGDYDGLYQVVKIENKFSEGVFTQTLSTIRRKNQEQDYEVTQQERQDNAARQAAQGG